MPNAGELRMNLPLCVGLACLREPFRRSTRLQHARGRPAMPVEFGDRIAAFEEKLAGERGGPLEVADEVMGLLRIAELTDARIRAGSEVLSLALPPARRKHRDLVVRGRLNRESHRWTAHVGVEIGVDDLSVGRDNLPRHVGHQLVGRLVRIRHHLSNRYLR
jgi:hypothetical protein